MAGVAEWQMQRTQNPPTRFRAPVAKAKRFRNLSPLMSRRSGYRASCNSGLGRHLRCARLQGCRYKAPRLAPRRVVDEPSYAK